MSEDVADLDPKKSKALRESLDELHAIRAQLHQQEKDSTPEQRIEKTRCETQPLIVKCGLKALPPGPDGKQDAERLSTRDNCWLQLTCFSLARSALTPMWSAERFRSFSPNPIPGSARSGGLAS